MKRWLAWVTLIILLMWAYRASAQNIGFEDGNLSNWTAGGGDVSISTGVNNVTYGGGKTWTVTPYGSRMAMLYPSGSVTFDGAVSSLGLNSTENSAIRQFMTNNAGGGNPTPTNATWIKRTVTLEAGKTYSFAWNYLSTDYTPFNDGSMMTLVHTTLGSVTPTLNNSQQRYALLGFTNPGTGNYSTDSYGSTGWQLATFSVPVTGEYVLGFATFNLGDTILSPQLFIDEIQGTTALNGQPFNPIPPNPGSTAPTTPTAPSLCCGGSSAAFSANPTNAAKINTFTNRVTQDSKVYVEQIGNMNTITLNQSGTRNNYARSYGNGHSNTVNIDQTGTSSTVVNYADVQVIGNNNSVSITQQSTGGSKGAFVNVQNNNNIISVEQKESGNHYAEITVSGGNKNVSVLQQGSAGHMASITLTGAATGLNLEQVGGTQQFYSITHNCATAGGCAPIQVKQGQ